jgi:hypothetical protein
VEIGSVGLQFWPRKFAIFSDASAWSGRNDSNKTNGIECADCSSFHLENNNRVAEKIKYKV